MWRSLSVACNFFFIFINANSCLPWELFVVSVCLCKQISKSNIWLLSRVFELSTETKSLRRKVGVLFTVFHRSVLVDHPEIFPKRSITISNVHFWLRWRLFLKKLSNIFSFKISHLFYSARYLLINIKNVRLCYLFVIISIQIVSVNNWFKAT